MMVMMEDRLWFRLKNSPSQIFGLFKLAVSSTIDVRPGYDAPSIYDEMIRPKVKSGGECTHFFRIVS